MSKKITVDTVEVEINLGFVKIKVKANRKPKQPKNKKD